MARDLEIPKAVRPIVVELFTSQGCSSCPPADDLWGILADRDDIIALSYHVDYWNGIGWHDPFSSQEYTQRQQAYNIALRSRNNYTPQAIIEGRVHTVGSSRSQLFRHIETFASEVDASPELTATLSSNNDINIKVGQGIASGATLDILLIGYDKYHETHVTGGENRGRTLNSFNVVRSLQLLGTWHGPEEKISIRKWNGAPEHFVVLLQNQSNKRILNATKVVTKP